MRFLRKSSKEKGYFAIGFSDSGIYAVCVTAPDASRPAVEFARFYPAAPAAHADVLQKMAKELHASRFKCGTCLDADEYQLLSVEAPNVPQDELKTAMRWRLKDMLDYHVDDATIDVLDVPVNKDAPVRTHMMFAVSARNDLVRKRQEMFEAAGIALSVIDIPEMAQRNLAAFLEPNGRALAMLSFDDKGGLLTLTYAKELYVARRIDVPLSQLAHGSVEQLSAVYERVTLELQRSIDHFDRQYHGIPLAKLVLSPIGQGEAGLQDYLAANLYIPVERLDLANVLDLSRTPDLIAAEHQQGFFMAIGAALRYEETAL